MNQERQQQYRDEGQCMQKNRRQNQSLAAARSVSEVRRYQLRQSRGEVGNTHQQTDLGGGGLKRQRQRRNVVLRQTQHRGEGRAVQDAQLQTISNLIGFGLFPQLYVPPLRNSHEPSILYGRHANWQQLIVRPAFTQNNGDHKDCLPAIPSAPGPSREPIVNKYCTILIYKVIK